MKSLHRRLQSRFRPSQDSEDEYSGLLRDVMPGGHVLTEAEPASPTIPEPAAGPKFPDADGFRASAHHQRQSVFFRLPYEVREPIYRQLLRAAGRRQHIFVANGRYTHTRCLIDDDEDGGGPDERQVELRRLMGEARRISHPIWARRLLSSWNCHWRCEEAAMAEAEGSASEPTPLLAVLLSCKMM
ncbi:uncharacterized protein ColSpa_08669 [Colletotrichum spaethianum]|uniref:DUF7730 domain-containing protein n=1 Tax=Colletotrichum spaethianum TaxID=700344 RepID=A0AA37PA51_9PEZI|nr:uncharacterized protein ColSpa_08669 [Colletotrichum spaethianum]GKT48488.1 hypothetical protein ColSpa_08669 [Colletotrichum spaethianum]